MSHKVSKNCENNIILKAVLHQTVLNLACQRKHCLYI